MATDKILFIGFKDQDNLGLGYLAAVLMQHNFSVELLDFRLGEEQILAQIRQVDPLIVGLSIIFQYYTPEFGNLVKFLRANGVECTICAGGHYPSLRPEDVFRAIPGLDCIVRFEGEFTLLELAQRLREGRSWHDLPSLAYCGEDRRLVTNPLRPLIEDLDALPMPHRWGPLPKCMGVGYAPILASRGCLRDCAFCSIRQFYSEPPGRLRRTRSPENVVQEILELGNQRGAHIFLFQDDDFALSSLRDRQWARDFTAALRQHGIDRSVMWKISCRADEVEPEIFADLQRAGLFLVYLGIESGNPEGLKTLNKHITVDVNRRAVAILNRLGLAYDFGFMLFDPSSTVETVLANIQFLRDVCGDGSAPIPFCKMLPYSGTDIESQLRQSGRLCGEYYQPDYRFLDAGLEPWYRYLQETFEGWIFDPGSVLNHLRISRFELGIVKQFCPEARGLQEHAARLTEIVASYNQALCDLVVESAPTPGGWTEVSVRKLRNIRAAAELRQQEFESALYRARDAFFALNRPA